MKKYYNPVPGILGDIPVVPPCPVKIIPPAQCEKPNKEKKGGGGEKERLRRAYRKQHK